MTKENNNVIYGIEVFRYAGVWAFDDERVGLKNEMFVAGADTLIDREVGNVDRAGVVFSTFPFKDYQLKVNYVEGGPNTGTDYITDDGHELWLCPALNLYYPESPETIYVSFKPIK